MAPDEPTRSRRLDWANLLRRAWGIDALACPTCDGPMRMIAMIEDAQVARKILHHLGLPSRAPPRIRPQRPDRQLSLRGHNEIFDGIDSPSLAD